MKKEDSDSGYEEYQAALNKVFSKAGQIESLRDVNRRSNRVAHKVAETNEGEIYGFKRWPAAEEHSDKEDECAERDLIANAIVQCVEPPNFCESHQVESLNADNFGGYSVAITKWMLTGLSFDEIASPCVALNSLPQFFEQYGKWVAFCEYIAYRDWTPNNCIWNESSKAFAMIDLDWCLDSTKAASSTYLTPILWLRGIDSKVLAILLNQFSDGILSMQSVLGDKGGSIAKILNASQQPGIKTFQPINNLNLAAESGNKIQAALSLKPV